MLLWTALDFFRFELRLLNMPEGGMTLYKGLRLPQGKDVQLQ